MSGRFRKEFAAAVDVLGALAMFLHRADAIRQDCGLPDHAFGLRPLSQFLGPGCIPGQVRRPVELDHVRRRRSAFEAIHMASRRRGVDGFDVRLVVLRPRREMSPCPLALFLRSASMNIWHRGEAAGVAMCNLSGRGRQIRGRIPAARGPALTIGRKATFRTKGRKVIAASDETDQGARLPPPLHPGYSTRIALNRGAPPSYDSVLGTCRGTTVPPTAMHRTVARGLDSVNGSIIPQSVRWTRGMCSPSPPPAGDGETQHGQGSAAARRLAPRASRCSWISTKLASRSVFLHDRMEHRVKRETRVLSAANWLTR